MSSWAIEPSVASTNTINPIRNIVDKIKRPENHPLPIIDVALGDPSVFGNLEPHPTTLAAVEAALHKPRSQGYNNSMGTPEARAAIAKFMQRDGVEYAANDICVTSGASQAILLAFQLLANPGDVILIPTPGFSLYQTICGHLGVEAMEYRLLPDSSWECDIQHIEALIQSATVQNKKIKAILINNPGNPTGSNYSRDHLVNLQRVLKTHRIPLVADEIYSYMLFQGQTFTPFAQIAEDVPVFTVSGFAKQFLVPGWRIGWLAICDRNGYLAKARPHLVSLTQVILGATTLIQHAIPDILKGIEDDSEAHYKRINSTLETQANIVIDQIKKIDGLDVIMPQGAMYLMVKIHVEKFNKEVISDDASFCQRFLNEQNVMLLPGSCFKAYNMFRVVFCAPEEKMIEFAKRLETFCNAHRV